MVVACSIVFIVEMRKGGEAPFSKGNPVTCISTCMFVYRTTRTV